MIFNHVNLESAVIFSSVVPLIFPPQTLIWKKMVLPGSNSLQVLELMQTELKKTFLESI